MSIFSSLTSFFRGKREDNFKVSASVPFGYQSSSSNGQTLVDFKTTKYPNNNAYNATMGFRLDTNYEFKDFHNIGVFAAGSLDTETIIRGNLGLS